jgi:hypothetical protein
MAEVSRVAATIHYLSAKIDSLWSGRGHQKGLLPEAFRPRPMKNYSRFRAEKR